MEEQLILISQDSPTKEAIIPEKGDSVARIAYEVLSENPYLFTESEFQHEVHVMRRNRPDLKINKYSIKRSPLLKKLGWGIHKNSNGKMALIPADSDEYRNLSEKISTVYASRNSSKKVTGLDGGETKSLLSELQNDLSLIESDTETTQTQKNSLIKARVGQGTFRRDLIEMWGSCAITGCKTKELLVASHIKPWREANNTERLDKFNGLLLVANIDRAFDVGLVSFDLSGKIIISPQFRDHEIAGISEDMEVTLKPEHQLYMEYHRKNVFQV
ncbi:TPA: DUF6157 family protein [Photobacterium damselae]|uniref:DUF6157 family protein n=1 Tax=Photobacterium damselae TaxID=38293 RepID=UPI0040696BFA